MTQETNSSLSFEGKVVVVTGAASGIGLALATRFVQEGATVIASDLRADPGQALAAGIGARFVQADVSREEDVVRLIDGVLTQEGRIDLFCSNAGIAIGAGPETADKHWDLIHRVNVMSHVWAARHLLPHYLERGEGSFLNTASAAGLLTELHSAPYAVTKHAALAFAEWLAITYRDRNIFVSALCPEGVWTPMIENAPILQQTAITTDELVDRTLEALRERRFLITTHASTLPAAQLRMADNEAWLGKMVRLRHRAMGLLADQHAAVSQSSPPQEGHPDQPGQPDAAPRTEGHE